MLLLTDPIDEWVVNSIPEYDGCKLRSVTHGEIDLDSDASEEAAGDGDGDDDGEKAESQPKEEANIVDGAIAAIKKALGERVADVRVSRRLTSTAACLVSKEGDPGANFERIMRMLDDNTQTKKRVLEVNPKHAVLQNMAKLVERDAESPNIQLWSEMLYQQALLSEGVVEDPAKLVEQIQQLLIDSSNQTLANEAAADDGGGAEA